MTIICQITSKVIKNNSTVVAIPLKGNAIFQAPDISYLEYDTFYSINDFPYSCVYSEGYLYLNDVKIYLYDNPHMVILPEVYNFLASLEKDNPSLKKLIWDKFKVFREHEFKCQSTYGIPDTYHSIIYTPFDIFSISQMNVPKYKNLILGEKEPLELIESYIKLKYFLFNLTKTQKILLPSSPTLNGEGIRVIQDLNKVKG